MNKNTVLVGAVVVVIVTGILYFVFDSQYKQSLLSDSAPSINTSEAIPVSVNANMGETNSAPVPVTAINKPTKNFMTMVTVDTNKGKIVFETYDADAPNTVNNFVTLANKKFYDGVIFHRVIKDFMIQGGDPTGTGRGGPGYQFADELDPKTESYKKGYVRGTVAMANAGPNTNGSQFFIMHKDVGLPNNYTIFGRVVSGMEVVDAIANVAVDESDKPLVPIVINSVKILTQK
jgi:cyclophilin family peptidyl-prolyl cis-trans isomerase